jgi:hypothetical protein
MAIDFTTYQPPGIYTEQAGGPQLSVQSTVPTAVAIFGTAVGYRTYRESVIINDDVLDDGVLVPAASDPLAKTGIKLAEVTPEAWVSTNVNIKSPGASLGGVTLQANDVVRLYGQTVSSQNGLYRWSGAAIPLVPIPDTFKAVNPVSGATYVNGVDYEVVRLTVSGTAENTAVASRDDIFAIKRIEEGGIEEQDIVQVSYRYTEPDYFDVYSLYDYDDVREYYGEPFNANGSIQSELTLAAKIAFLNGASTVLTCAVDSEATYTEGSNVGETKALSECYADALDKFRDEQQIAIIVPATGADYIREMVAQHVNAQSELKYERRAILGFDGSTSRVESSDRVTAATELTERRVALVSPSRFSYFSPELNKTIVLGGQFVAAAVAGKSVSQIASMPLTRKIITGFVGPSSDDVGREGEKTNESRFGLLVVEKARNNQVQVRHGVTTDPTDLLTREWSIIGQQDVMVYRVRDFLDADGLIGMPIYEATLHQVKASAEAALQSLIRDRIIVGFQNLKVRQLATLPDVVEVRYEWKPAYPLNYILVRYSVEVMTGDVVVSETTTA